MRKKIFKNCVEVDVDILLAEISSSRLSDAKIDQVFKSRRKELNGLNKKLKALLDKSKKIMDLTERQRENINSQLELLKQDFEEKEKALLHEETFRAKDPDSWLVWNYLESLLLKPEHTGVYAFFDTEGKLLAKKKNFDASRCEVSKKITH